MIQMIRLFNEIEILGAKIDEKPKWHNLRELIRFQWDG